MSASNSKELLQAFLSTTENHIVPLTHDGVASGSKVFGAAILNRNTLKPYTVATNNERVSPLLHGEINCIQQFFTADFPDPPSRPDPRKDCIFFATHEPCSLCLSGITWAGFSDFYFLFTYEDSRDLFEIPHDIDILQEVFRVKGEETTEQTERRVLYNKTNKFFKARSLADLADDLHETDREHFREEIRRVKGLYISLSETYQAGKEAGATSSSIWK